MQKIQKADLETIEKIKASGKVMISFGGHNLF